MLTETGRSTIHAISWLIKKKFDSYALTYAMQYFLSRTILINVTMVCVIFVTREKRTQHHQVQVPPPVKTHKGQEVGVGGRGKGSRGRRQSSCRG